MLEQYLDTLERIPDDVLLSALTRDMELGHPSTCLCGWVLREQMAKVAGVDAADVNADKWDYYLSGDRWTVPAKCAAKFGGTYEEWAEIFHGVCDYRAPTIERALALRVLEAVG